VLKRFGGVASSWEQGKWGRLEIVLNSWRKEELSRDIGGCLTVLGAWLRKRFSMSYSQCYGAEASASLIGSGVVSGVD
jgi:hypothetical protein